MEMSVVFHKEIKPVNKEHRSILDLKLIFRNYIARVAFVRFEVPCCFEVHIPVNVKNAFDTDAPEFSSKFYTTLIKSTKDHTVLPHDANLGPIQLMTSDHDQVFSKATEHTAHTLADTWLEYANIQVSSPPWVLVFTCSDS